MLGRGQGGEQCRGCGDTSCYAEELCLSESATIPSCGLLPHGKLGPAFSDCLAFSQAKNMHFSGKFSDFYSLRFSGLHLILSSNNSGAYSVTNSLKGTVASHFFSLLIYLCILFIVYY